MATTTVATTKTQVVGKSFSDLPAKETLKLSTDKWGQHLPGALLKKIFSYTEDRHHTASICKAWKAIPKQSVSGREIAAITKEQNSLKTVVQKVTSTFGSFPIYRFDLRRLRIDLASAKKGTDQIISTLLRDWKSSKITHLVLPEELIGPGPTLDDRAAFIDTFFRNVVRDLPETLTSLDLRVMFVTELSDPFKTMMEETADISRLTELHFSDNNGTVLESLLKCSCPALKTIGIKFFKDNHVNSLALLINSLGSLENLRLEGSSGGNCRLGSSQEGEQYPNVAGKLKWVQLVNYLVTKKVIQFFKGASHPSLECSFIKCAIHLENASFSMNALTMRSLQ